ncbi:V-type ATP synthase subunit F [Acidaminobacterium chupaoyuni]
MRYFAIVDNTDTQTGFRLTGIEGVVVHTREEVTEALENAIADPEIGIVLITEKLVALCHDMIYERKLKLHAPLLVEIPDRHGTGRAPDSITQYVRQAIGIKI